MHQPNHLPRYPVRLGILVAVQALPEVVGFPDVEQKVLLAAHQINAGLPGHALEEIGAKPLDQRLGRGKQAQLHGAHERD